MPTVVVAGATGFIGRRLCEFFAQNGWTVRRLVRHGGPDDLIWDGASSGDWERGLDGVEAVINLVGAPVTLPWNEKNRRLIRDSRTQSAEAIARAIEKAERPPLVWVNASAVGYYGEGGESILTEDSPAGSGFLAEVTVAWEEAAARWILPTRLVLLRTGVVLGKGGGAFAPLLMLTKAFLGGAAGSGQQWVPWISLEDLCRLYLFCIETPKVAGPVNGVSPEPIRNGDLMASIRRATGRPWAPPTPAFALALASKVGGPDPSVLLDSLRVVPTRAREFAFDWNHSDIDSLMRELVA